LSSGYALVAGCAPGGVHMRAKFSAPGCEGTWQALSNAVDLSRSSEYARALLIDDVVLAATERLEEAVDIP
jgi:hypothetical protein